MLALTACALKGVPVLECHPFAEVHGQFGLVVVPFPARGKLRNDVEVRVDIHELVAHRIENDAAGIGSTERRVQGIRIILHADA